MYRNTQARCLKRLLNLFMQAPTLLFHVSFYGGLELRPSESDAVSVGIRKPHPNWDQGSALDSVNADELQSEIQHRVSVFCLR